MPKIFSTIIIYSIVVLLLAGAATGSVYLYNKDTTKSEILGLAVKNFDSQQKQYEDAVNKLKDLKDTYIAQSTLNSYIASQYPQVDNAINTVDTLVSDTSTSSFKKVANLSVDTEKKITTLRQDIQVQLDAWKNTVATIKISGSPNVTLINQANSEISALQAYILQIQSIINSLTPNLGVSQQQINTYQEIINTTQQTVQTISNNLTQIESAAGTQVVSGSTIVTPVTQTDIQNQQAVVNQIAAQVSTVNTTASTTTPDTLNTTNTTNTVNTTNTTQPSGTYVPPPPKPGDTSAPKLIEGTNKY